MTDSRISRADLTTHIHGYPGSFNQTWGNPPWMCWQPFTCATCTAQRVSSFEGFTRLNFHIAMLLNHTQSTIYIYYYLFSICLNLFSIYSQSPWVGSSPSDFDVWRYPDCALSKVCWSPPLTAELLKCGATIWVAKITITFGECRGAHIKPINQPGLVHEGLTPTHSQTGRVGATLWLAKALFDWHEYPWVCCKAILWKGSAPCFFAAAGTLKIHTQNCQIQVRFPCKRKSSDWVIGGHISQYMSLRGWVGQAYIVHFHVHLDLTLLVQLSTKHTRRDRQTDGQTDRQAGRQAGRQADRRKE